MSTRFVMLCGSSAAGKSRLIRGTVREAEQRGILTGLRFAPRYTTRAARDTESLPGENRYVSDGDFDELVHRGVIDVHWRRSITAQHENRYGFGLGMELSAGGVVILSANNYLNWTDQPFLIQMRAENRLAVVRIWASRATRQSRLRARRPKLSQAEMDSRMADVPPRLLPPADGVVSNDLEFQDFAVNQFLGFLTTFESSGVWPEGDSADCEVASCI